MFQDVRRRFRRGDDSVDARDGPGPPARTSPAEPEVRPHGDGTGLMGVGGRDGWGRSRWGFRGSPRHCGISNADPIRRSGLKAKHRAGLLALRTGERDARLHYSARRERDQQHNDSRHHHAAADPLATLVLSWLGVVGFRVTRIELPAALRASGSGQVAQQIAARQAAGLIGHGRGHGASLYKLAGVGDSGRGRFGAPRCEEGD